MHFFLQTSKDVLHNSRILHASSRAWWCTACLMNANVLFAITLQRSAWAVDAKMPICQYTAHAYTCSVSIGTLSLPPNMARLVTRLHLMPQCHPRSSWPKRGTFGNLLECSGSILCHSWPTVSSPCALSGCATVMGNVLGLTAAISTCAEVTMTPHSCLLSRIRGRWERRRAWEWKEKKQADAYC